MTRRMNIICLVFVFASGAAVHPQSPDLLRVNKGSQSSSALEGQIKNQLSSFRGKVSLFAKNLDTGETYALNADDRSSQ